MLPKLTAEDSLLMRERLAVGTGALSADDARSIVDRWRRQAGGVRPERPKKKPTDAEFAAIGLRVIHA